MIKLKKIKKIYCALFSKQVQTYSAQAAFYSFLSLVPFCMLVLSVIGSFSEITNALQTEAADVLPEFVRDIVFEAAKNTDAVTVIPASVLLALWSASKGIYTLMDGISAAKSTERRLKAVALTLLFILVIPLSLIASVYGGKLILFSMKWFSTKPLWLNFFTKGLRFTLVWGMTTAFHFLLYMLSGKGIKKRRAFGCAVLSGGVWILISFFCSVYIEYFVPSSSLYGSLSAVVMLMLWLYACLTSTVGIWRYTNTEVGAYTSSEE